MHIARDRQCPLHECVYIFLKLLITLNRMECIFVRWFRICHVIHEVAKTMFFGQLLELIVIDKLFIETF